MFTIHCLFISVSIPDLIVLTLHLCLRMPFTSHKVEETNLVVDMEEPKVHLYIPVSLGHRQAS